MNACPSCGATLPDGAAFCPTCGAAAAPKRNVKGTVLGVIGLALGVETLAVMLPFILFFVLLPGNVVWSVVAAAVSLVAWILGRKGGEVRVAKIAARVNLCSFIIFAVLAVWGVVLLAGTFSGAFPFVDEYMQWLTELIEALCG